MSTAPKRQHRSKKCSDPRRGAPILAWARSLAASINRREFHPTRSPQADLVAFGWSIKDSSGNAKIKITGGFIEDLTHGASPTYIAVDGVSVSVSSGYNVIYVQYRVGLRVGTRFADISTVVANGVDEAAALAAVPANSDTFKRIALGCWRDHTVATQTQASMRKISLIKKYVTGNIRLSTVEVSGTRDDVGTTPEGAEAADTDTWDIADQSSGTPTEGCSIKMHSRTVYDHTGDKKLYGFYRTMTFDGDGRLELISAETRYEIDAPDDC